VTVRVCDSPGHPGPVHLLVEVGGHEVAFQPDGVDAYVLHQRDLPGDVESSVVPFCATDVVSV
jgi:hypothetical protein